jgi:hypothetical protein
MSTWPFMRAIRRRILHAARNGNRVVTNPLGSEVPTPPCRRLAVWLFFTLLVFFVLLTRGHFFSIDEVAVYQQARSLWEQGDLSTAPMRNTEVGTQGRYFPVFGAGQSVLALPLYAIGKGVHRVLENAGAASWLSTFSGRVIGFPPVLWSGEVEIFFVNLFNCITIAALATVFLLFSVQLGASPEWALVSSLLLSLTTHVAGFSTSFYQHGAEALLLLSTFYLLFADARTPDGRLRWLAGLAGGLMILVRVSCLVLLPILGSYLVWNSWKQMNDASHVRSKLLGVLLRCAPFLGPLAIAVILTAIINYFKFGTFNVQGVYGRLNPIEGNALVSLYAYLFSPGQSIFVFSPLLVLAPWYFPAFAARYRAEFRVIMALTVAYVGLYSVSGQWHGQWTFGPRYLMPLVPLLLLPLGTWLPGSRGGAATAVLMLALLGGFVQILNIAVNTSTVFYHEGWFPYPNGVPNFDFLFVPQSSQLVAHWKAIRAWDDRIDMWLVNVAREGNAFQVFWIVLILSFLLLSSVRNLLLSLREVRSRQATAAAGPQRAASCVESVEAEASEHQSLAPSAPHRVAMATGWKAVLTNLALGLAVAGSAYWLSSPSKASYAVPATANLEAIMKAGLDALYTRNDPVAAATEFRTVLAVNPTHYGATFQLATALDRAGKSDEALRYWQKMLSMADAANDGATAATARARLARGP